MTASVHPVQQRTTPLLSVPLRPKLLCSINYRKEQAKARLGRRARPLCSSQNALHTRAETEHPAPSALRGVGDCGTQSLGVQTS